LSLLGCATAPGQSPGLGATAEDCFAALAMTGEMRSQ
jgi:hypothetical protein